MAEVHYDLPYATSTDPRQALDLFLPASACSDSPLLVFIHGGAWRSESKADLRTSLLPALVHALDLPLAVLEYRLAPAHPHPAQILDVLSGLSLVLLPSFFPTRFNKRKLYLVGHSAGAFMLGELVLSPPEESVVVPLGVRECVKGVVCLDGIYDLSSLLVEYPSYASFVTEAFGSLPAVLASESPSQLPRPPPPNPLPKILVLHSREDELLSLAQPEGWVRHLTALGVPVEVDYESLKGGHDELLRRNEVVEKLKNWVDKCEKDARSGI